MSVRKFQNGEAVVVNDLCPKYLINNHGVTPNMEVKIVSSYGNGEYCVEAISSLTKQLVRISIPTKALTKITPKTKREIFQDQIEKAKEKIEATKAFIAETESKIKFMDEVGAEDFDENEFKAYHTLLLIEKSDMTTMEKAKAIAKLIANK
jgi:hypothetical protein